MSELKNFYEELYADDATLENLPVIKYSKYPVNRYEACIKYLIDSNFEGSILELGAGDGRLANSLLASNLKITKYVATDLAEARLKSIQNNIKSEKLFVKLLDLDTFNPDEIGEQYDLIIMLALIEHVINPITVMKKVRKLLKNNGRVLILTPNIAELGHRLKLLRGRFPSTASKNEGLTRYDGSKVLNYDNGHIHYFTYRSISKMLTDYCNFSKVEKYHAPTKLYLGKKIHNFLAKLKPEMFSSVFVIAYK